jgi:hypothetical protein
VIGPVSRGRLRSWQAPCSHASEVVTPLRLRALPVAMYCSEPGIGVATCRWGQRPVIGRPERLVELSLTARRATGPNRWYAWNLDAPAACTLSGGGGPTLGPVRVGSRLVFDDLLPPKCRGTVRALAVYVVQLPGTDVERATMVGRTNARTVSTAGRRLSAEPS